MIKRYLEPQLDVYYIDGDIDESKAPYYLSTVWCRPMYACSLFFYILNKSAQW